MECVFAIVWFSHDMRWCLSNLGSPKWILPITQSMSITSVSPSTHTHSVHWGYPSPSVRTLPASLRHPELWWWWEMDFPATTRPWSIMWCTPLLFHITLYPNPKECKNYINLKETHKHRSKEKPWTKGKTITPKENHKPKGKTEWLSRCLHLLLQPPSETACHLPWRVVK